MMRPYLKTGKVISNGGPVASSYDVWTCRYCFVIAKMRDLDQREYVANFLLSKEHLAACYRSNYILFVP